MMRRFGIALLFALLASMPAAQARHARGGAVSGGGGGGATLVFDYSAANGGFSGSPTMTFPASGFASISGSDVLMTDGTSHHDGAAWYSTKQNIDAFTTQFTFKIPGVDGYGLVFTIQNSNVTTNPTGGYYGLAACCYSANGLGYGAGGGAQPPLGNNIGIVFSTSNFNGNGSPEIGSPVSGVGLYIDGGPAIGSSGPNNGYAPEVDIHTIGPNLSSGDVVEATITYDGTTLTMVLYDATASTTTRLSWPIDIPAIVGADTAYLGFASGTPISSADITTLTGWKWWAGYNSKLSSPTFSVTPGQYTSTQSVSLSGPSGATIYYTTNGAPPTAASTQYTGTPISVSSSEAISAVAIESNFTDSPVAQGLYRIQSSSTPIVNFPSGFASANGLIQLTGYATIPSSSIVLTDTVNNAEISGAWYAAPIPVNANFSTTFTLDLTSLTSGLGTGVAFVLQNYPTPTSANTNYNLQLGASPQGVTVSTGGPWQLSGYGTNMGYTGLLNSVAVVFEYDSSNNLTGLYTDGAVPTGSSIDMTSSGVSLEAGHPLTVNLSYNASTTTLTETVTDTVNSDQFTHSYTINIPTTVGASNAYVGFTAATPEFAPGGNLSIASWTW